MAKKIGDSDAIRIYGPYPDERDASKWTVHVWLPGATKALIVPTFGFNLQPVFDSLSAELLKRLVERARKQGAGKARNEPPENKSEDDE